jgi:hypothetical protein
MIGQAIIVLNLFIFLFSLFFAFVIGGGVLKLAVPGLFDLVDLVLTEFLPDRHFLSLQDLFCGLLLGVRILFIKLSLGEVTQLESNLGDLAHVHAGCRASGRKLQSSLPIELNQDEILKSLDIIRCK